jgi:hypothetical protein
MVSGWFWKRRSRAEHGDGANTFWRRGEAEHVVEHHGFLETQRNTILSGIACFLGNAKHQTIT